MYSVKQSTKLTVVLYQLIVNKPSNYLLLCYYEVSAQAQISLYRNIYIYSVGMSTGAK